MAKAASIAPNPTIPKPVTSKDIKPPEGPGSSQLDDSPLPISHPTVAPIAPPAHAVDPIVTCDGCKGWRRSHPRSAMGQCLINSRYASGPVYTTDLATCSNADPIP